MPDVLMPRPMMPRVMEGLKRTTTLHRLWEAPDPDAFLAEIGPRVRAIATGSGCDAALIEKLPKLELISSFGVGYDSVDIAAARARAIHVTNTPDVLNDAVAEITLGLMLALCRRIVDADRFVRAGKWTNGQYGFTAELTGRTVGIVGLGRIGKEIARRCQAFKMQVVYHGRRRQPDEPYPYYPDLVDMAEAADWLVAIVPGGAETHRLIGRRVMEALGPEGYLVNMGRGTSVDEPALIECLERGVIGGAALDVFEDEPRVPEALFRFPNVVLSPHQGSATTKTRNAMADMVVNNIVAHFAGLPLLSPVA